MRATAVLRSKPLSTSLTRSASIRRAICFSPKCRTTWSAGLTRKTGIISTIAGTGTAGFSGDGGPAAAAQLRQPHSIAFDPQGRLLICDIGNLRIRRVDLATGKIETWAGNGEKKPTPDGAPIAGTPLNGPRAITVAPDGNLYLVLREGNAVFRDRPRGGKDLPCRRDRRHRL